jgi:mono/diheme cytochrome c family protein
MPASIASSSRPDFRAMKGLGFTFLVILFAGLDVRGGEAADRPVDFNREIRPILSNRCYACHGPDAGKRKGVAKPMRLDTEAGAFEDLGGYSAIVRGKPDESELIQRIRSEDPNEVMPPPKHAQRLPAAEIERITRWVAQGAPYARHWSYARPTRPELPDVKTPAWPRNVVDRFILARAEREGLNLSPEADRQTLVRRVTLDVTGLPPTPEEVDAFVKDGSPAAYENLVDSLLARPSYGEHAARLWLDLARYADSSGYADDPARTIWAYRDYVIRSFNANKPFDRFTIEQIAGDLLPDASDETRIATAFHRNTMTNNEGGTVDEEFRNAAIVDRVNTTMAVWMGTTIACAQCHDHKYDPLSQADFFRLFAFFNNTQDADKGDESPTMPVESDERKRLKAELNARIESLERTLETPTPETGASFARWQEWLSADLDWKTPKPAMALSLDDANGDRIEELEDNSILIPRKPKANSINVAIPLDGPRLTGVLLEALPHASLPNNGPGHSGRFVVNKVVAAGVMPPGGIQASGRYIRIELPGRRKMLSLAEVQVFRGTGDQAEDNIAIKGEAKQSSTAFDGPARLAIDGNTNGDYVAAKSTTHTTESEDPWWEVDLKESGPVFRVVIWNRTDSNLQGRLAGARVVLLDEKRETVWSQTIETPPQSSAEFLPTNYRKVTFSKAFADDTRTLSDAAGFLNGKDGKGWSVDDPGGSRHALTFILASPVAIEPGSKLVITFEHGSKDGEGKLGHFRVSITGDDRAGEFARTPSNVLAILKTPDLKWTAAERLAALKYYLASVALELKPARDQLASLKKQLADLKPETTVPVLAELPANARRKTKVQMRGNYLDLGAEVSEGVPEAIFPLPPEAPRDRLALARWLVSDDNPMTARVVVNRAWEQVFGSGLVPTSEEFGSQGEPPTHPELLDWLATELVAQHWDLKQILRLLVTSSTYRQTSKVTPDGLRLDPGNQWLARGPRFRLPAETVRDQALAIAGLLSPKIYGPPVRPPQPSSGLNAAFGGKIDWQTSMGDDKYRRALYTSWRRSNPYPSMATFDAPNREICTVRRTRTNTPLQALVTLNDPVYVEASQALARRMAVAGKEKVDRIKLGVKLCLSREPSEREVERLSRLYDDAFSRFAGDPDKAKKMATDPLGPAKDGSNLADLAAWTVVANVLLNLDETLMRR